MKMILEGRNSAGNKVELIIAGAPRREGTFVADEVIVQLEIMNGMEKWQMTSAIINVSDLKKAIRSL